MSRIYFFGAERRKELLIWILDGSKKKEPKNEIMTDLWKMNPFSYKKEDSSNVFSDDVANNHRII